MTTFIPVPADPQRSARIREHAMQWYGISDRGAERMPRPVKVRLITNPAAAIAYGMALLRASLDTWQREQGDPRR